MKQYKVYRKKSITNKSEWTVITDIESRPEFLNDYLFYEDNYLKIILEIFGLKNVKEFLFEIQFKYKLDSLSKKQLSKKQLNLFKKLSSYKEGEVVKLENKELESCIIFILRECFNALILNKKKEFIFGYVYDYYTLICTSKITDNQLSLISDLGFVAEEYYFDYEW